MNEKKIAFIICADDAQYYEECMRYIGELEVPDGYETDTICIQEAESIAEGYHAGMQASDAKYKIYMHQDVFIRYRRILYDVLDIFASDAAIGMIGVAGTSDICLSDELTWKWDVGKLETWNGRCVDEEIDAPETDDTYSRVRAVAGALIITQYDVPWREDIITGWSCYEVSQSLEMARAGYQVVVPMQEVAWCYHDCGVSELNLCDGNYERLMREYPEASLKALAPEQINAQKQAREQAQAVCGLLFQLIERRDYEQLSASAAEIRGLWSADTQIREIMNLMEIYTLEKMSISGTHSELFSCENWAQMQEYYRWLTFVLKRIEWEREDARIEELKELLEQKKISADAIRKLSAVTLKHTEKIYARMRSKKEEPLVSVIVPVYNGEQFVAETLESILAQTYENIEVIVVDDASTDASRDVIQTYAARDLRVRPVFLEHNSHICYAGNVGFAEAQGKYVALIGHDDLWRADKLEKQVAFLEEHSSYSVCFTWADIVDEDRKSQNENWSILYQRFCGDNMTQEQGIRKLVIKKNFLCAPSACIRRECLKITGYYRYALVQLQDYDLWLRLLCQGPFYMLQEKLTYYRRFSGENKNLSCTDNAGETRTWHEVQWIMDSYLKNMPDELFVRAFRGEMKNKEACGKKEIACEKAFLLWDLGCCFAEKWFVELFEDTECREILERNYQFTLQDFYKMNTEPMYFDITLMEMVRRQQSVIEEYKKRK